MFELCLSWFYNRAIFRELNISTYSTHISIYEYMKLLNCGGTNLFRFIWTWFGCAQFFNHTKHIRIHFIPLIFSSVYFVRICRQWNEHFSGFLLWAHTHDSLLSGFFSLFHLKYKWNCQEIEPEWDNISSQIVYIVRFVHCSPENSEVIWQ